jgi:hypothetical protein
MSDAVPAQVPLSEGLGLYPERDNEAQGNHYIRHAEAMTREGLHSKSRIAGELAARDIEIANLRAALKWYADGKHFSKADPDAWDTVSDEPQNWWCDEAGTAMVEDGSLAAMVLAGKLAGQKLTALQDGEEA